jgi:hypothetical protein
MRMLAVRNRNLSLWQSAVAEIAGKFAHTNSGMLAMEAAANLHAATAANGVAVTSPAPDVKITNDLSPANVQSLAYVSKLVFDVAHAYQMRDSAVEAKAMEKLKNFVARQYSTLDLLGWMQCVWRYLEYYVSAHRTPPYVDWAAQSPSDINLGVIEYRLPKTARVLLLGDWGTHMSDNIAMLREALRAFKPDVIMHLGDVYYSGTKFECEENVLNVLKALVAEGGINRPPFFTIPGNHEYYSGGGGFFDMISNVNSGLLGCLQKASYFCLRTEDDRWQFLGMDTGYNDRDPVNPTAPGLQSSEIKWHRDKLDQFTGSTVLLSHHQLYSAHDKLGEGARPYLNESLYGTFKSYFDRISAWYWGHEHNYVVFEDGLFGLRKGRLIGCSAYEEAAGENPYDTKFPSVRYAPGMKQLGFSPYQGGVQQYYNHAIALLCVSPAQVDASYYEFPSWDRDFTPSQPDTLKLLFQETIAA